MAVIVSLKAFVREMDVLGEGFHAYINSRTGELVTIGDEEIGIIGRGAALDDCPEWQQEAVRKTREVIGSDEYLPLPDPFEIHEYAIIERFCSSREDGELREMLLSCIRGSGAFRRFKEAIHDRGIAGDWYQFREAALEEIAIAWLDSNSIGYTISEK